MKGEGGKGAGKDWAEILRGAFQVKGFTGVPPGLEKKKKRQEKKASPKDHYAKQPRWSKGYGEEKKKKLYSVIRSNMVQQKDCLRPPENGMRGSISLL